MSIQDKVAYTFESVIAEGSVIDLSRSNDRTVALWGAHGGDNQKWTAHQNLEGDWSFKNAWAGLYLGIQGDLASGATLIGVQAPVYFAFTNTSSDPKDVVSLFSAADKNLFIQVANGISQDGNKLQIEPCAIGDARDIQLWKVKRCDGTSPGAPVEHVINLKISGSIQIRFTTES